MSTPTGEPMFPEDYGSPQMTREMLMAEAPSIAADPEAVKAVLKEYFVLLMYQYGDRWIDCGMSPMLWEAAAAAKKEYHSSKVIKEAVCR